MFGGIGVQNRRDIVLGVHRGKQHAGNGQYPVTSRSPEAIQTIANDRVGKFQIAVINHPIRRQQGGQLARQHGKLVNSRFAARSMAADHDPDFRHVFTPFAVPTERGTRPVRPPDDTARAPLSGSGILQRTSPAPDMGLRQSR